MFQLIRIFFLAANALFRIRNRNANARSKQSSTQSARRLAVGGFASVAASLDLPIRTRPVQSFSVDTLHRALAPHMGQALSPALTLLQVHKGSDRELLVIANGKSQEVIPGRYENRLVDRFYSCSIYVHVLPEGGNVEFRSSFPEDKEQQFLLEDLADLLYAKGQS